MCIRDSKTPPWMDLRRKIPTMRGAHTPDKMAASGRCRRGLYCPIVGRLVASSAEEKINVEIRLRGVCYLACSSATRYGIRYEFVPDVSFLSKASITLYIINTRYLSSRGWDQKVGEGQSGQSRSHPPAVVKAAKDVTNTRSPVILPRASGTPGRL